MRPSELAQRLRPSATVLWRRLAVGMLVPPLVALALSSGGGSWTVDDGRGRTSAVESTFDAPADAGSAAGDAPAALAPRAPSAAPPSAAPYVDDLRRPLLLPSPAASATAAIVDGSEAASLQAALDEARDAFAVPGLSFAVAGDEGIRWTGATGATTADAALVVGSVTKTFVAAAVLQLVEEGVLRLDDRVTDHLPEARVAKKATIRQLLSHSSGVADLFTVEMTEAIDAAPGRAWEAAEVLATIGQAWFEPGDDWAYSNTNYLLLGMLVERVTGHSLGDVLHRRFVGPLGLAATGVIGSDGAGMLDPALATAFWGSGSMRSTSADIARWGQALYGGDVLGEAALHSMLTFNEDDYGLGTQRVKLEPKLTGYGHSGLLGTYTTLMVHLPSADVTVAIIAQQSRADLHGILGHRAGGSASLLDLAIGRTPSPPSPSPTVLAGS